MSTQSLERALKMAVVTGLRSALGPALIARAGHSPDHSKLALLAMGELVADKLPFMPGRDTLLPTLARGAAGYWVAKQCAERDGDNDPWIAPLGAVVAMGVAVFAPKLRNSLAWSTGMSQPVLGLIEDVIALKLGAEATGLTLSDLSDTAKEAIGYARGEVQSRLAPVS